MSLLAFATPAAAQSASAGSSPASSGSSASPEAREVVQVVTRMFDAMRARDTAAFRSVLDSGAVLLSVGRTREGTPVVRRESMDDFVKGIAGAPAGKLLDERIYDPEVRIDGGLATVWTEYDFYLGDSFSHCGVDAFMLARLADGWKVIAISDTRRRDGCPARK